MEADYDLYDVLDLPRDASADDVRASFRTLSRMYHPDKQEGGGGSASGEAFMRVHRAYRVLGDDALRAFYDRYGLAGIRLAEDLSEEEGEVCTTLSLPEDRLQALEGRVRRLLQKHEELRISRLLALQGSFVLAVVAGPGPHGARMRRRYRLHYAAGSQSVQVVLAEGLKLSVGCATHVQGGRGPGAAKLMIAATSSLSEQTSVRVGVGVGQNSDLDVSMFGALSPHCMVHQKVAVSRSGSSASLTLHPWLSKTLRGKLGVSLGQDPSLTCGFTRRSSSSGHSVFGSLTMRPQGDGELSLQAKFKPAEDFSLRIAPSISPRGWAITVTCTKAFRDGLTKLQWALRVRRRSACVRLSLQRAGLRFVVPIDIWPETAGPLPAQELALALALWTLPPLGLRLIRELWLAGKSWRAFRQTEPGTAKDPGCDEAESAKAAAAAAAQASVAAAKEQRRLVSGEAARRRGEEELRQGLVILRAAYGDAEHVEDLDNRINSVIDVTDCLMAKVRQSQLHLSDAPKSSLLGFHEISGSPSVLRIHYRYGRTEHTRTFKDKEPVLLP